MPEHEIIHLAHIDWRYASAVTGPSEESDWATAQEWEANSVYVCRPANPGTRRRPSGLKVFASLRGLDTRRLRADKAVKAPESTNETGSVTDDKDEEGNND